VNENDEKLHPDLEDSINQDSALNSQLLTPVSSDTASTDNVKLNRRLNRVNSTLHVELCVGYCVIY
ncbi:hypothetical protein SARC_17552, partial [Sphaeroforma arctica JP610]